MPRDSEKFFARQGSNPDSRMVTFAYHSSQSDRLCSLTRTATTAGCLGGEHRGFAFIVCNVPLEDTSNLKKHSARWSSTWRKSRCSCKITAEEHIDRHGLPEYFL